MDEIYEEAFLEVSEILKIMPDNLSKKIPQSFKDMVEKNKSTTYNVCIHEPLEKNNLKEETIAILGLIYRDFLCDDKTRKKLRCEFQKELDKELAEEYKTNNLFKKKEIKKEECNYMVINKEKWYQKLWNCIFKTRL